MTQSLLEYLLEKYDKVTVEFYTKYALHKEDINISIRDMMADNRELATAAIDVIKQARLEGILPPTK